MHHTDLVLFHFLALFPITSLDKKPHDEHMQPDQKNQIIIILSGSTVTAIDNVTQARLEFTTQAKTSRLEDDTIAQTDGLIQ